MDWPEILALVGSNLVLALGAIGTTITLFLWSRSEAREDRKNDQDRWITHRNEMLQILKAIQDEMKDFHSRLIDIEKKKMQ